MAGMVVGNETDVVVEARNERCVSDAARASHLLKINFHGQEEPLNLKNLTF